MAYYPHKHHKRKDGSSRWRVVFECVKNGKRIQRIVTKNEWAGIGFSEQMSLEEAQAFARSINTEVAMSKQEERRQAINTRLSKEAKELCVYLPEIFVRGFEIDWVNKQDTKANVKSHWRAAQRIIKNINMHPHEWSENPDVLFNEFVKKKLSLSYSEKLLRVLNEWGIYISRKTSKFFIPVKPPKGKKRERINDAGLHGT